MNLSKEQSIIESILFLEAEPVDLKIPSSVSQLSQDVVIQVLADLKEHYTASEHGIELVEIGGGFLLVPKQELWDQLKSRYGKKNDNKLSKAAIETLSIIAYSQPITKSEIESIRGVSADNMIRTLLHKDLIKEVGKKDAPGKPTQYGTTKTFLRYFKLNSIADLPKLSETESERFELNG
ncbi:MAG: SMC-Scp complex subunit ScpB [Spirochaetia bacterium]